MGRPEVFRKIVALKNFTEDFREQPWKLLIWQS